MSEPKAKYKIVPEYVGKTVYTIPQKYARKEGSKFVLDSNLSQKDLGYLHDVIKYPGVVKEG